MSGEKPKGLSNVTVILMIITALFFDLLQFLLSYIYMDWLVGIFAGLTFFLWFLMKGIKLLKPKRLAALGGASIVEMVPIPFIASLPAWTAAVVYTALDSKIKAAIPGADMTKLGVNGVSNWKELKNHQFNPNNSYRVVGESGYREFADQGIVRASPTGTPTQMAGRFNIGNRTTSFPSFAKGAPDLSYGGPGDDKYIFETSEPLYRRGDINPVNKREIGGRHYADRPIDKMTGRVIEKMPKSMIDEVYRVDKRGRIFKREKLS